jgi:uncharacterized protein YjiK
VRVFGIVLLSTLLPGCVTSPKPAAVDEPQPAAILSVPPIPQPIVRKQFRLALEAFWRLELPDSRPFDASGLIFDGQNLLMVSDKEPELFRIILGNNNSAHLERTGIFTRDQLASAAPGVVAFDFEGLARDENGRLYVCEEARRSIFRFDPASKLVERLEIDWAPVRQFFSSQPNSSFEGIAVAGGKLWIANERDQARLIEVDLESLKVVGDSRPLPSSPVFFLHYSDLAAHNGHLFLLLRHQRLILEMDLDRKEVLAEYDFYAIEEAREHQYVKEYPTGAMEGLAVDDQFFWLVTDNNGFPRKSAGADRRPTLFKCPRPSH